MSAQPQLVEGRSCDGCTLCCKVMAIAELAKPKGEWCTHCGIGKGCRIYAERPAPCVEFYCMYLINPSLGEHWKPSRAHMVITRDARSMVYVRPDPGRPEVWRKEPYYADLKKWSARFARAGIMISVCIGDTMTIVLPDRDIDLGREDPTKQIRLMVQAGPKGPRYDVQVIDAPKPKA
jgi:hypothetical protein